MQLKKLPIGIQTFRDIREENYLYIDKTNIAYTLIENYKYVFLSRPRRFGKSLFMDTVQEIFQGDNELFKGLAIYDKWDWKITYPVIKIDFNGDLRSGDSLKTNILSMLKSNQKRLDVECEDTDNFGICLKTLIENIYIKYNQKVVVLVDEYDKAILDNLDQMVVARENREIIKSLYSVLKGCDQYLKFVMLTGVSKFSKSSIFSGLNMLEDISLNDDYGDICGYTQEDVETTFAPYLVDQDYQKIKRWYNGYNFLQSDMYNPFDLLQFIRNKFKFKNYWFSTGTPTFLIKLIEKNNYFLPKLTSLVVGEKLLDSFDIDNLDLEVILYQAGYLTIDEMQITRMDDIEYKLKLPNEEVKKSFNDIVIDFLTNQKTEKLQHKHKIYDALEDGKLDDLETSLFTMFESIPYNNFVNNEIQNYEGYYASVIYVYFQSLGIEIIGEDVTNKGRIDLTLKLTNFIYIVEFKVEKKTSDKKSAVEFSNINSSLQQIKDKQYQNKYMSEDKDIFLVGINFDKNERNISKFGWEKV
ncbi:MAG: ATP-binding protein [Campylobacterota bacterium]|nr:ATP-binding protein [Campylobacterota bacterium]